MSVLFLIQHLALHNKGWTVWSDAVGYAGAVNAPDNNLDTARLAAIYDGTAAFYDGVVAEQQSRAKLAGIEALAWQEGERLLEVGTGTGWLLERLLGAGGQGPGPGASIVATDVAAGMLTVARERVTSAEVAWALADVTALPFEDAAFDCLLCTYTLEVLPAASMLPAVAECRRVLQAGGRAVFVNLTSGVGEDAAMTDDWLRRFVLDPEAFGGARPIEASALLQAAGFVEVSRRYVGVEWPSEVLVGLKIASDPNTGSP